MTKISRRKEKERLAEQKTASDDAWLSWRTGLITNTVVSLALAAFIAWQIYPFEGLGTALLWGGGAGLSIWVVFFISYRLSSWLRRRQNG